MRTITNNYRDAQILNLGSGSDRGPYLVTQTGVSPKDVVPKTRMFVLRPDGNWVDFNAYASQGKPEAMDEIVFSTTTQVMETFGNLFGQARVLDLPPPESARGLEIRIGAGPAETLGPRLVSAVGDIASVDRIGLVLVATLDGIGGGPAERRGIGL